MQKGVFFACDRLFLGKRFTHAVFYGIITIEVLPMKYTARSSKYILKNFWYIIPFAIIPAFFLSLSTDHEAVFCAMETMLSAKPTEHHFIHIFSAISVLNFSSWQAVVFGLVASVCIVVCVAMMMALLDKHMRIGKRTYNGVFAKLNDNLLSTCGYVLLVLFIYELWSLITAALLFFFTRIPSVAIAYGLSAVVYLLMHIVLIYLIGLIYLWLPCMQITGFRAIEALQYSYQLIAPVKWKILIGQVTLLLLVECLVCVCAYFTAVGSGLFTLLTTVLYTGLIMIYCVRMMVAYFDRDNIERADLKKYYQ